MVNNSFNIYFLSHQGWDRWSHPPPHLRCYPPPLRPHPPRWPCLARPDCYHHWTQPRVGYWLLNAPLLPPLLLLVYWDDHPTNGKRLALNKNVGFSQNTKCRLTLYIMMHKPSPYWKKWSCWGTVQASHIKQRVFTIIAPLFYHFS